LGAAIAIAFATGQLLESLVFGVVFNQQRLILDVIGWGLLGGLAVWSSLTWVSRQERRYQAGVEQSLLEQQELNRQLKRANSQLALLSDVNREIADSATLDEILTAALAFPQQLVPAHAAALILNDAGGEIETRLDGARTDEVAAWRKVLGVVDQHNHDQNPYMLTAPIDHNTNIRACLVIPLCDGHSTLGRIELYIDQPQTLPPDELDLLQTIASEISEAIVSSRRRSREERALFELERAIADERARIARDIHDGIAQTLAFRRMRIDLWLDWLDTDRERLRQELIESKQILREQISELRRAIFALRPVQFDELGFVGGLHRYIVEFASQQGWDVHVDLNGAPSSLTPELEALCFRIVQESLTNIAKHAHASRVDVQLDTADDGLRVGIRDNGDGFEPGDVTTTSGGHLGLRQMQERLQAMRGRLTILSQPGAGTEVRAWTPLQ
jgi:signal transduction histidine kinase